MFMAPEMYAVERAEQLPERCHPRTQICTMLDLFALQCWLGSLLPFQLMNCWSLLYSKIGCERGRDCTATLLSQSIVQSYPTMLGWKPWWATWLPGHLHKVEAHQRFTSYRYGTMYENGQHISDLCKNNGKGTEAWTAWGIGISLVSNFLWSMIVWCSFGNLNTPLLFVQGARHQKVGIYCCQGENPNFSRKSTIEPISNIWYGRKRWQRISKKLF
jgi:hypothetical protein